MNNSLREYCLVATCLRGGIYGSAETIEDEISKLVPPERRIHSESYDALAIILEVNKDRIVSADPLHFTAFIEAQAKVKGVNCFEISKRLKNWIRRNTNIRSYSPVICFDPEFAHKYDQKGAPLPEHEIVDIETEVKKTGLQYIKIVGGSIQEKREYFAAETNRILLSHGF